MDSSGAYTAAESGTAFTFGEGTVVTCWHCLERAAGPDETFRVRSAVAALQRCTSSSRSTTSAVKGTALTWRSVGSEDSASGLYRHQIRVAAFQTQCGTDSCDHSLGG